MHHDSKEEGVVSEELARKALDHWMTAAAAGGVDLSGLDPTASHDEQVSWARSKGFYISTVYSRVSTQMQQSTEVQVRRTLCLAAANNIFVPPRFISIPENGENAGA